MTQAQKANILREEILRAIDESFTFVDGNDFDIFRVGGGEIALRRVNSETQEDEIAIVKVTIPKGTRNGKGGFDPYDPEFAAEEYERNESEKEAKKAQKAAEKAEKEAKRKANTKSETDADIAAKESLAFAEGDSF